MTKVLKGNGVLNANINAEDLKFKVNSLVEITGFIPIEINGSKSYFIMNDFEFLSFHKDPNDVTVAFIFSLKTKDKNVNLMFESVYQILVDKLGKQKRGEKIKWPKEIIFKMWT